MRLGMSEERHLIFRRVRALQTRGPIIVRAGTTVQYAAGIVAGLPVRQVPGTGEGGLPQNGKRSDLISRTIKIHPY